MFPLTIWSPWVRQLTDRSACVNDQIYFPIAVVQFKIDITEFLATAKRKLAGYQNFLERFYNECNHVSMHLLEVLELSFGLLTGAFTSSCSQQAHELRLNHFPTMQRGPHSSDKNNRVWPHTDLGVITCLFKDGIGGLEVENPKLAGHFVAVVPGGRDKIIVNVAETLERWTNGVLKAGVHRVVPPRVSSDFEEDMVLQRYSSPFFVTAERQAKVGPLSHFIKNNAKTQYADISALEYHTSRVAEAY
jgi:isopenicillin N synthase-like dioxygenase